jgi:hypothetical protein
MQISRSKSPMSLGRRGRDIEVMSTPRREAASLMRSSAGSLQIEVQVQVRHSKPQKSTEPPGRPCRCRFRQVSWPGFDLSVSVNINSDFDFISDLPLVVGPPAVLIPAHGHQGTAHLRPGVEGVA